MKCWIVTDGKAGTENQCIGVAEALGARPEIKRVGLRPPWSLLSPYLGHERGWSFRGDSLSAPFPDLVLASGRRSIAAARYIRRKSGGQSYIVQIQDPRARYDDFDLVAVPAHDPARGANVFVMQAAPNRITPERLDQGIEDFAELFAALPAPRVAVLIGGDSKSHKLTPANLDNMIKALTNLARQGHSLMITTSRRTGADNVTTLQNALAGKSEHIYFWDGSGENPYHGMLGWADFIMVSADSVSMVSEAATTGKPVYILPVSGGSKRFHKFYDALFTADIVRPFVSTLKPYSYQKLQDAPNLAAEIKKRLAARGMAG